MVGDIIDFWAMARGRPYFPLMHRAVMRKVMDMAKGGTRVIYIPGNHDENLRTFAPFKVGDIEIMNEDIHVTVSGERMLVIHGDAYDQVVENAKWLAHAGDIAYASMMRVNFIISNVRAFFGKEPWSLSKWVKHKVKQVVSFIGNYEQAVGEAVVLKGVDGVICGHIHHAEIREIEGIRYHNCGDWVESCTALLEDGDGKITIYTH
jgi:UDP-2,3-diacylglucosamine pyrophosphatase LpxH